MRSRRHTARLVLSRLFGAAMLFLPLAAGGAPAAHAASPAVGEYAVKAAFLYNIIKFVDWPAAPAASAGNTIVLCMIGNVPEREPFDDLDGLEVRGKRLEVVHLGEPRAAGSCSVLFIGPSEERGVEGIVQELSGVPVLTVGDTAGFARRGVMINFYLEKKKVRFEINNESARRSGIGISAKLLRLAGAVYGGPSDD